MKRIEKIKSMDATELAEVIFNIGADNNIDFYKNKKECAEMLDRGEADEVDNMRRQCLIDWLMEADDAEGD